MKKIALIIGSMIAGGIISAAGFTWFAKAEPPAEKTSTAERKILFWYDPMYPNTRFDKPGKSPFMDMDLVPKYADEESSASGVRIDPTQTQNLGVKTATVTRGPLTFARVSRRMSVTTSISMPLCRLALPGLSTRCIRLPWAIKCKRAHRFST